MESQSSQESQGFDGRERLGRLVQFAHEQHGLRQSWLQQVQWVNRPGSGRQRPNYLYFPELRAQPQWRLEELPEGLAAGLVAMSQAFTQLSEEFEEVMPAVATTPNYTGRFGANPHWRGRTLIDDNGQWVEGMPELFGKWHQNLLPLWQHGWLSKCFFALLPPGKVLEPHYGGTNLFLRFHFGIKIPKGRCSLQLEQRDLGWQPGEWLLFDDTFLHGASNHTEWDRWILLMRVLHPDLTTSQRRLAQSFINHPEFMRLYYETVESYAAK